MKCLSKQKQPDWLASAPVMGVFVFHSNTLILSFFCPKVNIADIGTSAMHGEVMPPFSQRHSTQSLSGPCGATGGAMGG